MIYRSRPETAILSLRTRSSSVWSPRPTVRPSHPPNALPNLSTCLLLLPLPAASTGYVLFASLPNRLLSTQSLSQFLSTLRTKRRLLSHRRSVQCTASANHFGQRRPSSATTYRLDGLPTDSRTGGKRTPDAAAHGTLFASLLYDRIQSWWRAML